MKSNIKINELRSVMGTLPSQSPNKATKIIKGVEGVKVDLVDYNVNPYKSMYILATTCWENKQMERNRSGNEV